MIVDIVENLSLYGRIHPRLAAAFDFLTARSWSDAPPGKVVLDGEKIFAIVNAYETQPAERCRFEAHRRYTDIQYMVAGVEKIGVTHLSGMTEIEPYSAERDIAFYRGTGDTITLSAGTFAIFFPHDAHQPGIALAEPMQIRKVVFKVDLHS